MRVSHVVKNQKQRRRRLAVELATMLPVLVFWSMATVDFARLAYVQVTLQNCARRRRSLRILRKIRFFTPFGVDELGDGRASRMREAISP